MLAAPHGYVVIAHIKVYVQRRKLDCAAQLTQKSERSFRPSRISVECGETSCVPGLCLKVKTRACKTTVFVARSLELQGGWGMSALYKNNRYECVLYRGFGHSLVWRSVLTNYLLKVLYLGLT